MKRLLSLLLLTAAAGVYQAQAQPGPVSVRPDCFQFFTFTATGTSAVFDNRSAGCPYFAIAYSSSGFATLSIVVQVAPDNNGVPGAWATYTANSGINPNTAITQAFSTFSGYFPWVRVNLTAVTGAGSLSGIVYGWRTTADVIVNGGSAGCPNPCPVDGVTAAGSPPTTPPVLVAGIDGTNIRTIKTDTSGDPVIVGTKTNNNAAPGATNVGVLPCLANAAAPTDTEGDQVTCSVDLAGNLRIIGSATISGNGTVLSGQQAVTGSAVALATNTTKSACVKALVSNTINVFVGPSGITTATGFLLAPGESFCAPVTNTNLFFVIASTTGASVSWIATN